MRRPLLLGMLWLAVMSAATAMYAATDDRPVRVLLVTGVDYEGHHWKETAPLVRTLLEKDRRLLVREVDDLEFLATPVIFDYEVILLHLKNYDPPRRPQEIQANLTKFVQEGRGLVLTHFACGAFQDWPGFVELAGRVWDPQKRPHDPRGPFAVRIVAHDHPITRGLDDFEVTDELYTCLGGEPAIDVLATARSKVDGQDYPMAFVLQAGQGRVFQTVLGHDTIALGASGVERLLQRACLWAAGRPCD